MSDCLKTPKTDVARRLLYMKRCGYFSKRTDIDSMELNQPGVPVFEDCPRMAGTELMALTSENFFGVCVCLGTKDSNFVEQVLSKLPKRRAETMRDYIRSENQRTPASEEWDRRYIERLNKTIAYLHSKRIIKMPKGAEDNP
jgi:hypothetical protein